MHLAVIGHTAHYQEGDGYLGWGPTVKEVDWLAKAFDRVTHLACLHTTPAPLSALPYTMPNVALRLVPPAGGLSLGAKGRVVALAAQYVAAARRLIAEADVVQIRVPGPLGMYGMFALTMFPTKVGWIKYAGNWNEPTAQMPLSFRLQRWWLQKKLCRQPITINGAWPGQPAHVYSFLNPSLKLQEVVAAKSFAQNRRLTSPLRLIFVGRVETPKGIPTVLHVVSQLRRQVDRDLELTIIGDGPERPLFEEQAAALGISDITHFCGWLAHEAVLRHMQASHLILLPSSASEGWPKVLSEAMNFGVVPVTSDVSAIPQILARFGAGVAVPANNAEAYVRVIQQMLATPAQWQQFSVAGSQAAAAFTYEQYLLALDKMFVRYYGSSPMNPSVITAMTQQLAQINDR